MEMVKRGRVVLGVMGLLFFAFLGVPVAEVRGETVQHIVFNQVTGRDHDTATDPAELSFIQNPWQMYTYIGVDDTKTNVVYVYARYTVWNDNNYTQQDTLPYERHKYSSGDVSAWFYINDVLVKYWPSYTMTVATPGSQTHSTPYWAFTVHPKDVIHVHMEVDLYAYGERDNDGDGAYEEEYTMDYAYASYDFYVVIYNNAE